MRSAGARSGWEGRIFTLAISAEKEDERKGSPDISGVAACSWCPAVSARSGVVQTPRVMCLGVRHFLCSRAILHSNCRIAGSETSRPSQVTRDAGTSDASTEYPHITDRPRPPWSRDRRRSTRRQKWKEAHGSQDRRCAPAQCRRTRFKGASAECGESVSARRSEMSTMML